MHRLLSFRSSSHRTARTQSEKGSVIDNPSVPYPAPPLRQPSWSPPPLPGQLWHSHNSRGQPVVYEDGPEDDEQSNAPLVMPAAPPPPPNLKVKRVDYFYSSWGKTWKYRNTSAKVRPDALQTVGNGVDGGTDPWESFCFVVVRKLPQPGQDKDDDEETFRVVVKSRYLLIALKEVIGKVQGVSWTAEPLEVRIMQMALVSWNVH